MLRESEPQERGVSFLEVLTVLLKHRWLIIGLGVVGGLVGVIIGLTSPKVYRSEATFVPQRAEPQGGVGGLAAAAARFGIEVPAGRESWGPEMYVELLHSRALLEPISTDTVEVLENGRERVAVLDLLEVEGSTEAERVVRAMRKLRNIISPRALNQIGAVRLSVTTKWPSVSYDIAEKLIAAVQRFNIEISSAQAGSERQFAEERAQEAQAALRDAENALERFLQRNRSVSGSPELRFEMERLQREVALRQELYTSLLVNREQARLREVRDTPVITVIEEPKIPPVREPRRSLQKGVLGGGLGFSLGVLIAFFARGFAGLRREETPEAKEFLAELERSTPAMIQRKLR